MLSLSAREEARVGSCASCLSPLALQPSDLSDSRRIKVGDKGLYVEQRRAIQNINAFNLQCCALSGHKPYHRKADRIGSAWRSSCRPETYVFSHVIRTMRPAAFWLASTPIHG
jgi:hypothetical protein